jgi:RimJ/RimL family protein N-acetyltransferase
MDAFRPPQVIETDHLTLRPFVAGDAHALYETMLGDAVQTRWLPLRRHRSAADSVRYIHDKEIEWLTGACFAWALVERASGTLVGSIELHVSLPRAELGAMISARASARQRRAGLAALLRLVDWLLAQPQLHRVHACCAPDSPAASTLQRLGFTLEGRLANWLFLPNAPQRIVDALLFARCRATRDDDSTDCEQLAPAVPAHDVGPFVALRGRSQDRSAATVAGGAHAQRLAQLRGQRDRNATADANAGAS